MNVVPIVAHGNRERFERQNMNQRYCIAKKQKEELPRKKGAKPSTFIAYIFSRKSLLKAPKTFSTYIFPFKNLLKAPKTFSTYIRVCPLKNLLLIATLEENEIPLY